MGIERCINSCQISHTCARIDALSDIRKAARRTAKNRVMSLKPESTSGACSRLVESTSGAGFCSVGGPRVEGSG